MRRRLYLMLPNTKACYALVADLRRQGIADKDIHVIARPGVLLEGLNQAPITETSELTYGAELGLMVGGLAGLLGGMLAIYFPPAGLSLELSNSFLLMMTTFSGMAFGGVVAALVAHDIPNHRLAGYQQRISKGHILLLLDIPTQDVKRMQKHIQAHYAEAALGMSKIPKSSLVAQTDNPS